MRLIVLTCLLGIINLLGFAPFHLWPLQILSLWLLFLLIQKDNTPWQNARLAWAYSSTTIGCGMYWLGISMHQFGGMPMLFTILAVITLAIALGSIMGFCFYVGTVLHHRWKCSHNHFFILILPVAWTLGEWIRGWIFTGLPWLSSGYAHSVSPLAGYAPLLGVYGVGWIAALIATLLHLQHHKKIGVCIAAFLLLMGNLLHHIPWTKPYNNPITIRLLQTNIPQEIKFNPNHILDSLSLNLALIRQQPADLIVAPETSIPLFIHQLPKEYFSLITQFAHSSRSSILFGIPIQDSRTQYTNSALLFSPTQGWARYDKHHLVPFGEFIPWGFHWFLDLMHIPLGDFSRGKLHQAAFSVQNQWILPNICYEDLFGEEIASQLAHAYHSKQPVASILLNMSNIAWFGNTIALPQHLQISQMRALETRRPMLRATNTGMTALIQPNGEITHQIAPYRTETLTVTTQGFTGLTPYILTGNASILLLCSLSLCYARWYRRRTHKESTYS